MKPINITKHRGDFFKILHTTPLSQIGVMTLGPGDDSGPEDIHQGDQIVYIIEGQATIEVNHQPHPLPAGTAATIPAQAQHHIYNKGDTTLFFLTIYTPPAY